MELGASSGTRVPSSGTSLTRAGAVRLSKGTMSSEECETRKDRNKSRRGAYGSDLSDSKQRPSRTSVAGDVVSASDERKPNLASPNNPPLPTPPPPTTQPLSPSP